MVRNEEILFSILTAMELEQIPLPLGLDLADDRRTS
jgi:hypothetical protein